MDAADTIRSYYDALRAGDPLGPYFLDDEGTVKFGISETLRGHDEVVEALAAQTARTTDWSVESRDLLVRERDAVAWFADDVAMGWTDTERAIRFEFETRWSGTLVPVDDEWRFASLHVSTPGDV